MKAKIFKKTFLYAAALIVLTTGLLLSPSPAQALTCELGYAFSGSSPAGDPPWLTATFVDLGSDTVRLTMAATNLTGNEFATEWDFNLDPTLNPTALTFDYVSGVVPATISTGTNAFKANGDGWFDIGFFFPTAAGPARFSASDSSVYDISGIAGLTTGSFDFYSLPGDIYCSAAHVQGIAKDPTSGWIADPNPIPEPATMLLVGSGLVGLAAFGRKRLFRGQ